MPPFASEAQRKYLWANEPKIAKRWADEAKGKKARKKAKPEWTAKRIAAALWNKPAKKR